MSLATKKYAKCTVYLGTCRQIDGINVEDIRSIPETNSYGQGCGRVRVPGLSRGSNTFSKYSDVANVDVLSVWFFSFSNPSWCVSMRYIEGSFSYAKARDSTFYGRGWIPAEIVGYGQDSGRYVALWHMHIAHHDALVRSLRSPEVSLNRLRLGVFKITTPPPISDATRTNTPERSKIRLLPAPQKERSQNTRSGFL